MLLKLRQRMASDQSGFTLVELLVVMLILGLLAAIAIPSFFNQRDKAKDADAKEAARTAQTAVETWATDHDGKYNGDGTAAQTPDAADLQTVEPALNNADISNVTTAAKSYSVTVDSETGNTFTISRADTGILDSECTTHEQGGCPSDGNWAADGS